MNSARMPIRFGVTQLSLAYLSATGLIAALVLLALWNRKQGWRKRRGAWLEDQAEAALRAFELPPQDEELSHFADLSRLHQSLVAHGAPQQPEPAEKPLKSSVLA